MYKAYCRIYQTVLKAAAHLLPFRKPTLISGYNSIRELSKLVKKQGFNNVLIVTDKVLMSLGLLNELLDDLKSDGISFVIYDETVPNPTIDNIEEALVLYNQNCLQSIIAFGGGSALDCGKGVAARVAKPNKTIRQLKGLLKIRKRVPTIFAVPTTAGTGSETTLAIVVTDSKTHEKYAINDVSLIPRFAVLDPKLTEKLPPHITSTTGMDALTHAVEAFIGRSNTKETTKLAKDAVKMVFDNVYNAYLGNNIEARDKMLTASFYAGAAFTRAYVGYVHAIAHTLGGFYSVPHGLANAVILPYVLEYFGSSVYKKLSILSDILSLTKIDENEETKAKAFISAVKELNKSMNIPNKIVGIKKEDIKTMVERAFSEANPTYPVPKILLKSDIEKLYHQIMQ